MKKNHSVTKSSVKSRSVVSALKVAHKRKDSPNKEKSAAKKVTGLKGGSKARGDDRSKVTGKTGPKGVVKAAHAADKRSADKRSATVVQIPQGSLADRLKIAVKSAKEAAGSPAENRKIVSVVAPVPPVSGRKRGSAGKVPAATIPVTKISRAGDRAFGGGGALGIVSRQGSAAEGSSSVRATARVVVEHEVSVHVEVFVAGDKIVYPQHGVGEVECVSKTMVGGQELHVYDIKILETGMKIRVPVTQAASNGLRRIIDKRTIDKVYEILRDRDFKIDTQTWNRRAREYSQKIKTGSVYEIAMVLRDLSVLGADKELSFGEKQMLEKAEARLVSEIALAKARPHDKIVGELRELLS